MRRRVALVRQEAWRGISLESREELCVRSILLWLRLLCRPEMRSWTELQQVRAVRMGSVAGWSAAARSLFLLWSLLVCL